MKNLHIDIVDRIVRETSYDWDYVAHELENALANHISPIDFFDSIVDSCLG